MPSTDTKQNRGQALTIREADTFGQFKCNRCKTKLKPGECVRDKSRPGYLCKEC